MKKPFIIVFDNISDTKEMEKFTEAITSSFISKRGKSNAFFIVNEKNSALEVHTTIKSKINFNVSFLVASINDFYGGFLDESVVLWMKAQFPELKWVK